MRSTKSIRRDIQIYVSLFTVAFSLMAFFAIACFVYLTFNNAMLALLFLLIAAPCAGKWAKYSCEHREAIRAKYVSVETNSVADYSDH